MTGLAIALVLLTTGTYLLLRDADRWAWHPPRELTPAEVDRVRHATRLLTQAGMTAREAAQGFTRLGDALSMVADAWALAQHRPLADGVAVCWADRKPWPCPEHERLTASMAARRARLGLQDPETVGGTR